MYECCKNVESYLKLLIDTPTDNSSKYKCCKNIKIEQVWSRSTLTFGAASFIHMAIINKASSEYLSSMKVLPRNDCINAYRFFGLLGVQKSFFVLIGGRCCEDGLLPRNYCPPYIKSQFFEFRNRRWRFSKAGHMKVFLSDFL